MKLKTKKEIGLKEEHIDWIIETLKDWFDTYDSSSFEERDEDDEIDEAEAERISEKFDAYNQKLLDKIRAGKGLTLKEQDYVFFHLWQKIEPETRDETDWIDKVVDSLDSLGYIIVDENYKRQEICGVKEQLKGALGD